MTPPTKAKKIFYNSPEAAQIKTVTGWVSANGRFWGNDEHMARFDGATHNHCACGAEMQIGYAVCISCQEARRLDTVSQKYPKEDWDGTTMVYSHSQDRYFHSIDEVEEFIGEREENGDAISIEDLYLVHCEPAYLDGINADSFNTDDFPEDAQEDDLFSKEVQEKIKELNELIAKQPPIGYFAVNVQAVYKPASNA